MSCRVLEASAEENLARMKRMKRSEGQGDMSSPADWIRQDDWPVGIRNVGNTCWFSAVIQVRRSVWESTAFSRDEELMRPALGLAFVFETPAHVKYTRCV